MAGGLSAIKNALSSSASTYHVYKDAKGEWRWHLKTSNGNKVASSGEGYVSKADCLHGIELVKASMGAEIVED